MLDRLHSDEESQIINQDIREKLSMLPSPKIKIPYPYDINFGRKKRPEKYHFAGMHSVKNIGNLANKNLIIDDDVWIHHMDCQNIKLRNTDMYDAILYNINTGNIFLNNSNLENLILCNIKIEDNLDLRRLHYTGYVAIIDVNVKGRVDIRGMDSDNFYTGGFSYREIKIHEKHSKMDITEQDNEERPIYNLKDLIYN